MYIEQLLRTQDSFARQVDFRRSIAEEGRGLESIGVAICPTCDRATVLEEHEHTPQLGLVPEEQRDGVWYSCEWCGSEITKVGERAPRKPARGAGESEIEQACRMVGDLRVA